VQSDRPAPLFNSDLFLDGQFVASPGAWWPQAGVAAEVESKQWHLLHGDWERTLSRRRQMAAAGITVVQFTPGQLRTDPDMVLRDIAAAIRNGHALPRIITRPPPEVARPAAVLPALRRGSYWRHVVAVEGRARARADLADRLWFSGCVQRERWIGPGA
jgi:hypothetical protein